MKTLEFFHFTLDELCLLGPCFVQRGIVMLELTHKDILHNCVLHAFVAVQGRITYRCDEQPICYMGYIRKGYGMLIY